MKLCVLLIVLTFFCPGGCPVYDFDLKTIEGPSESTNNLKVQVDSNSEIDQDLIQLKEEKNRYEYGGPEFDEEGHYVENYNKKDRECAKTEMPIKNFVGSNLFDGNRKKCFSTEDVALLTTRKDFEILIPKDLPQTLLNDEMVGVLMRYFYGAYEVIERVMDDCSKILGQKSFYDMLGGYLKFYLLPVTKYSFYGGQVSLKTVENIMALYYKCKMFLNTNGNGWKAPVSNIINELNNVQIQPLKVKTIPDENEEPSCCIHLDLTSVNNDADEDQMIVSLPKLEPEDCDGFLGNVWLPFKRKRTYNLRSSKSAFIVVKFYETVTRCYRFQGICQDTYNHKFKAWILENIQVHLSDEQFYPGLGAILSIYENLRRGKKSAENINDQNEEDDDDTDEDHNSDVDYILPHNRQKTEEFNDLEKLSKHMEEKSDSWFDKIYNFKSKRKECKPGKAYKSNVITATSSENSGSYLKCLLYAVGLILLLLFLVLLCALWKRIYCFFKVKYDSWGRSSNTPREYIKKSGKPPAAPPCKRKKKSFCERFCRRKKKEAADEEIIVKPETKSVLSPLRKTTERRFSTSSSSLACHPKKKCIPCGGNRKGRTSPTTTAPIIETTSLDCSSSETDQREKKQKHKQKVVTIDEKKKLPKEKAPTPTEPIYENVQKDDRFNFNKKCAPVGLQLSTKPKPKPKPSNDSWCESKKSTGQKKESTSWDTVFDT